MKKLLIFATTLLSISQAFAYTHTITNTTNGNVDVKVNIIAGFDKHYTLKPGQQVSSSTLAYCTRSIDAVATSGDAAGLSASGSLGGNTCRGIRAYIGYTGPQTPTTQTGGQSVVVYTGTQTTTPRALTVTIE